MISQLRATEPLYIEYASKQPNLYFVKVVYVADW